MNAENIMPFEEAVRGLLAGDFTRLAPLFEELSDGSPCLIRFWHGAGRFNTEPQALAEAFTCACFLGRTEVAEYLLSSGIHPSGGIGTGLNAFHRAVNRARDEAGSPPHHRGLAPGRRVGPGSGATNRRRANRRPLPPLRQGQ